MKKFAAYFGLIATIFIVLMIGLDRIYTYAFTSGIPRSKLQHILQQKNKTYDYLFLGSSRTEFHIDCDLIEELTGKSCINYGTSGTTLKDSYSMLQLLDVQGIKFKNVFVQVDYMFNDTDYSPYFRARLLAHQQEPIVRDLLKEYDINFADTYIPFYRYIMNEHVIGFREVFNHLRGAKSKTDFENGYIPKFGSHEYSIESWPSIIIESNPSINAMTEYFAEHGVKSFFFVAPLCDSSVNRRLYVEFLKTKIPSLYDYVSLYDGKDEDFYFDCSHLNYKGAQDFTRILTNELILNKK